MVIGRIPRGQKAQRAEEDQMDSFDRQLQLHGEQQAGSENDRRRQ